MSRQPEDRPRLRRRIRSDRPAFVSKTISFPIDTAAKVERSADVDFGGNESALVTKAVNEFLGISTDVELEKA
jgi:hypothetical protein